MSVEERLVDLILDWEEAREEGRPVTPEQLCRDCPELLDELRRRVRALEALAPALGAPADYPTGTDPQSDCATLPGDAAERPRPLTVPGYEILEEVGRGGMGVVYKARQKSLDRIVALKLIRAGADAGNEQRERFRAEALAVARLQHPNIVQVYEAGEHDGCPYLTLEYVAGRSLQDLLHEQPPSLAEAASLVAQLADAVGYAHAQGVVHRDLKPANVLLVEGGGWRVEGERQSSSTLHPKITDFGLAKFQGPAARTRTRTGVVLGTPSYMAPEQAAGRNREVGPAADIYALGATLYELLTGRPPFAADTAWETVERVLSADAEPPSRHNRRVPRDLDAICLKCLEKEPARRYPSARALADDLHRFSRGEPVAARPVGWVERAGKWVRRRLWRGS